MNKTFIFLASLLLIIACGGGSDEDVTPTPPTTGNENPTEPNNGTGGTPPTFPQPEVILPTITTLEFPNNNQICTEAKDLTPQNTNTIEFRWTGNASMANPVNYEVILSDEDNKTVRNLNTLQNTPNVVFDIDGLRPGGAYKWQVIASKEGINKTDTSEEFFFFNAGIAQSSYAPVPAIAITPTKNQVFPIGTTQVTLEWVGNDQDNDITEYVLTYGPLNTPPTQETFTNNSTSKTINVNSNTIYTWKVVTQDAIGNTSTSSEFKFAVQ